MDLTLYWFMFPVAMFVSTCAMMTGIGGSALFIPIYVLAFPVIGAEYSLDSTFQAVLISLITMGFSFASGVGAYAYSKAIKYRVAYRFLAISVPAAAAGSFLAASIPEWLLIALYSVIVFVVASVMLIPKLTTPNKNPSQLMSKVYTSIGGFTTGSVAVGIGEVMVPQLLRQDMSPRDAAGTSVFIVFVTVLAASTMSVFEIYSRNAIDEIPLNILCYTIPGVLIGAQLGARVAGRIDKRKMELAISILFFTISILMTGVAISKFG